MHVFWGDVFAFKPIYLSLVVFSCMKDNRVLIGGGFLLCIESLQFLLRVGVFKVMYLVLNTLGVLEGLGLWCGP